MTECRKPIFWLDGPMIRSAHPMFWLLVRTGVTNTTRRLVRMQATCQSHMLALCRRACMLGEVFSSDSDCEIVRPQSFSFSRRRQAFHVESQGDMIAATSPEDVQPLSRGRTQEVTVELTKDGLRSIKRLQEGCRVTGTTVRHKRWTPKNWRIMCLHQMNRE